MMNDLTNAQGISNPRLVSASTQMFTTPIKPLVPFKPLSDMGRNFPVIFLINGIHQIIYFVKWNNQTL